MVAPELDRRLFQTREGFLADKNSEAIIKEIYTQLDQLEPCGEDDRHEIWFPLNRGTIDDYEDFESMLEDGEVADYDEYVEQYNRDYPTETKWYYLVTVRYKEYITFFINGRPFVKVEPENYDYRVDLTDILSDLKENVAKTVETIKQGKYNEWLERELPHIYRFGLIKLKTYWELGFDDLKNDYSILSKEQEEKFYSLADTAKYNWNDESNLPENCLPELTAAEYKRAVSLVHQALFPKDTLNMTVEEMYAHYADDRDGGLCMIDQNSPKAFEDWYNVPSQKKWELYTNPSHMWEAVQGSSRGRMLIRPHRCDKGWFFTIDSNVSYNKIEMALAFITLYEAGIPVKLYEADTVADLLSGNANLGIMPCFYDYIDFSHGGFPADNVYTFRRLDENGSQMDKLAEWLPLKDVKVRGQT